MALAPAHYAADVEHALLIISEPSNNSVQFSATHNYQWPSQTRFDPCGQLQKTIQAQRAHLNNRCFLVIDGLYRVDFDTKIPNTPSTQSNETAEHLLMIQDLLISNEALFMTNW